MIITVSKQDGKLIGEYDDDIFGRRTFRKYYDAEDQGLEKAPEFIRGAIKKYLPKIAEEIEWLK